MLLVSHIAQEVDKSGGVESIYYICKEIQNLNLNRQNCKALEILRIS